MVKIFKLLTEILEKWLVSSPQFYASLGQASDLVSERRLRWSRKDPLSRIAGDEKKGYLIDFLFKNRTDTKKVSMKSENEGYRLHRKFVKLCKKVEIIYQV